MLIIVIIIFALRWYLPIEKLKLGACRGDSLFNSCCSANVAHPHGTKKSVRMGGPPLCWSNSPWCRSWECSSSLARRCSRLGTSSAHWSSAHLRPWGNHMEQVDLLHVKDVENSCAGVCIPGFCFVLLLVPTIQCNEILQRHYKNGIKRRNRLWPSSQKSTKG